MKKPVTVKMTVFSARHKWLVFGLWILIMVGFTTVGAGLPATSEAYDQFGGFNVEAAKAAKVFNQNGQQSQASEDFFLLVTNLSQKAADPAFKSKVDQIYQDLSGFTYEGKSVFTVLLNPYQPVPGFKSISDDGTTARIYGQVSGQTFSAALTEKLKSLKGKLTSLKQQNSGYNIMYYSQTLSFMESNENTQESLQKSIAFTIIPTFLVLLIVFGTLVSALVPLILALTAIMGTTGVTLIYSHLSGNTNIADATLISVLMGLAVAVDYSLFVISRYRTERSNGKDKLAAIEIASGTAGRAVFFSGILVAISMVGLLLLGGVLVPVSLSIIVVVLLSVVGSVTFLPALLSIAGDKLNWGRLPYLGRPKSEGNRFWAGLVRWVMRHPVSVTIVTCALLLVLAGPLLHIRLGTSLFGVGTDKLESTRTAQYMLQKWPEGTELKVEVVVTGADKPETQAAIEKFQQAALNIPQVHSPVVVHKSGNGQVVKLDFTQPGSANDAANQEAVTRLRNEVIPANFKDLSGVEVYVGGYAAMAYDTNKYFTNPIVWVFVLSLSFVVLLVVFRSLVIAIKAIILNLLTTGAAYGVVILVFQDGLFGLKPASFLENFVPVFMFAIIFGLSMDYHIFILTRVKELRDKGLSNNEAVARGIASTSGTITGAAAIMVIVFGDFFINVDNLTVQQQGLGLAVAVLLDATIVRSMLLPAVMRLMGEFNWWLPRFLNWLPSITIEMEPETAAGKPELTASAATPQASLKG